MSVESAEKTQVCNKCKIRKPVSEFHVDRSRKEGTNAKCKKCIIEYKKEWQEETKDKNIAQLGLNRIEQFLQSKRPPSELTDDEIFGRYIFDENNRPVLINSFVRTRSFQNAWSKEVSFRLNQYLADKTPRALEVMFDLMNSDLVEPADRIKAAQFIIERTMGKNPEVLMIGGMNDKPYQTILETIESGSREAYRKAVDSSRLEIESADSGNGIHSDGGQIIDAEITDDPENDIGWASTDGSKVAGLRDSGQNGNSGNDSTDDSVRDSEQENDSRRLSDGSRDSDTGIGDDTLGRVQEQNKLRARAKEMAQARAKAKQRRFAARAVGATSLSNVPFLLEYKIITKLTSPDFGKFYLNLIHPKDITEKVIDRVARSNDPTRQAEAIEAMVAKVAAKMSA